MYNIKASRDSSECVVKRLCAARPRSIGSITGGSRLFPYIKQLSVLEITQSRIQR